MVTGLSTARVLLRNSSATPCGLSGKEWLSSAPRGAYTAARTVGRDKIFELSFHINRVAESVRLMGQSGNCDGILCSTPPGEISSPELLRPEFLNALCMASTEQASLYPDYNGELRVIVLVTWGESNIENDKNIHGQQGYDLYVHMEPLPSPSEPPIKVLVKGHPRENPVAKDSEWVRDRAALELDKPKDVNEILLMDANGGILEGMTSNFFTVENGVVVTPSEGILMGSVRDLVLRVCGEIGIPVKLYPPNISNAQYWDSAFITSTSRLVLGIDVLEGVGVYKQFGNCDLVNRLKGEVLARVEKWSEPFC